MNMVRKNVLLNSLRMLLPVFEHLTGTSRLVHRFQFSTDRELAGRAKEQLGTLIKSPVLTGRSNDQESCDQAVVHTQWSAMDHYSIIALLLLYRRRKCRRNSLHWVHPIIKKRKGFGTFYYTLLDGLRDDENKFLYYFRTFVPPFDALHRRFKDSLQRRTSKMRNCIQPV